MNTKKVIVKSVSVGAQPSLAEAAPQPEVLQARLGAAPKKRRRSPPKLRPGGSSTAFALEFAGPVNLAIDRDYRPLTGRDIAEWREANGLERLQIVQMLAMANPHAYNKITNSDDEPLPFDLEMLLRHYMRDNIRVDERGPIEVFEAIYGPRLREFEGLPSRETARVMLYARFGALLGRTVFTVYRWFKANTHGDYGGTSGTLRRLFSRMPDDPRQMREELESLARQTFRARGYDFDALFPMPSVDSPPVLVKRGRKVRPDAAESSAQELLVAEAVQASAGKKEPSATKSKPKPRKPSKAAAKA